MTHKPLSGAAWAGDSQICTTGLLNSSNSSYIIWRVENLLFCISRLAIKTRAQTELHYIDGQTARRRSVIDGAKC
ncbi:MAG TPA: hypothetical protein DHV02_00295 [Neisseriales bacterium]|nr:hypothetical protein [Neisseriales bacterium]